MKSWQFIFILLQYSRQYALETGKDMTVLRKYVETAEAINIRLRAVAILAMDQNDQKLLQLLASLGIVETLKIEGIEFPDEKKGS